MLETILFLMGKRLLLGPSIFYLAPGSNVFREIVGNEWEPYTRLMRSSAMFPANPLFPRETTYTLMKLVRFVNYVKQVVDRSADLSILGDLAESLLPGRSCEREIVRRLLVKKRFTRYGLKEQALQEEPQNSELVELFFRRARGLEIKGFKTGKSVKVDV